MYADDIIVMSTTEEGLQKVIDYMYSYCDKWRLKVNSDKTKVTMFGSSKIDSRTFSFSCNGKKNLK